MTLDEHKDDGGGGRGQLDMGSSAGAPLGQGKNCTEKIK